MKYYLLIFIFFLLFIPDIVLGQDAETMQKRMLKKIEDSLALTSLESLKIELVNKSIHAKKMAVRQTHKEQFDSLQYNIQRIENTRDSLYKLVLPENKYSLYIQKKKVLLTNN